MNTSTMDQKALSYYLFQTPKYPSEAKPDKLKACYVDTPYLIVRRTSNSNYDFIKGVTHARLCEHPRHKTGLQATLGREAQRLRDVSSSRRPNIEPRRHTLRVKVNQIWSGSIWTLYIAIWDLEELSISNHSICKQYTN